MDYVEIPDYITLGVLTIAVVAVCFVGFAISISINTLYNRFRKPPKRRYTLLQIDHISRVYEAAKDGIYRTDMKAALDGLQELRNIACEQTVLNDK
ncbi:hypothetical protein [Chitinophaga ginsengisegetis]|uniref:hypothetical protein n=1 Tax=Chitinophaga ginsengisegetis TaxID=393003 RepID=UPI000DB9C52C|nr:hypothetical protein [Chitinophaga ginsengisegetis]MDR6565489.1 hypothetical protein [Chitinophaga ginsengisegetis]MDR6645217.1 hypothetical protein [Chitinophaga ginsengisegetis]MDR6652191.1 hypothetical protein [Chitinophaga ginsengisegetis]